MLSLTRRGMFVLFDRLFQGYLSTSELPRDEYRLNELETALEGRRTGRAYKLADLLPVRVIGRRRGCGGGWTSTLAGRDGDAGRGREDGRPRPRRRTSGRRAAGQAAHVGRVGRRARRRASARRRRRGAHAALGGRSAILPGP